MAPGYIIVWRSPVSCGRTHLHRIQPSPQVKVIFWYLRPDALVSLFFRLFTQVHLMIYGSVEGQYFTMVGPQFLKTLVLTQLLNTMVGPQPELSTIEADNPTVCLHGPKSTPNRLFFKISAGTLSVYPTVPADWDQICLKIIRSWYNYLIPCNWIWIICIRQEYLIPYCCILHVFMYKPHNTSTQQDSVVQIRPVLLTSDFGSSTQGERQFLKVFRIILS